jgi:hypothetical protein
MQLLILYIVYCVEIQFCQATMEISFCVLYGMGSTPSTLEF